MMKRVYENSILATVTTGGADVIILFFCTGIVCTLFARLFPATCQPLTWMSYAGLTILCHIPAFLLSASPHGGAPLSDNRIASGVIRLTGLQTLFLICILSLTGSALPPAVFIGCGFLFFSLSLIIERLLLNRLFRYAARKLPDDGQILWVGSAHDRCVYAVPLPKTDAGKQSPTTGSSGPGDIRHSENATLLGSPDELPEHLQAHPQIHTVYCASENCGEEWLQTLYRYCCDHHIRLYFVPGRIDCIGKRMEIDCHRGQTLLSVRKDPLQQFGNRLTKRTFDIVLSTLLLLTVFPVIAFISALFIKLQSTGPVLEKRKYRSIDGHDFFCLAFRCTHYNRRKSGTEETGPDETFPFGRLLAFCGLIHAPRLINVLQGTLSFIGPGIYTAAQLAPHADRIALSPVRYWYKPGLIAPQRRKRPAGQPENTDNMDEALSADTRYMENWSLWLDIRSLLCALCRTVIR